MIPQSVDQWLAQHPIIEWIILAIYFLSGILCWIIIVWHGRKDKELRSTLGLLVALLLLFTLVFAWPVLLVAAVKDHKEERSRQ